MSTNRTLDLGCGNRPEHWQPNSDGVDKLPFGQRYVFDLEQLLPWEIPDNTYEEVVCQHILEHIQKPEAFIHILNEIYRVLKPGGIFRGASPHGLLSPNQFRDPFHCRMITEVTFDAFLDGSPIHFNDYGVKCRFTKRDIHINPNRDVVWSLGVAK